MLAYGTWRYTSSWLCFWQGLVKWAYLPIYSFDLVYFRTKNIGDNQEQTVQIWNETEVNLLNGPISKLFVLFISQVDEQWKLEKPRIKYTQLSFLAIYL